MLAPLLGDLLVSPELLEGLEAQWKDWPEMEESSGWLVRELAIVAGVVLTHGQ